MLLLNCALKLVEEIILYYDGRSKKHEITLVELLNFKPGGNHRDFKRLDWILQEHYFMWGSELDLTDLDYGPMEYSDEYDK